MPDIDLDSALSTNVNHLADLAQGDPDRLATFLETAGVRGIMESDDKCPLANWLSTHLDGASLAVSGNEVYAVLAPPDEVGFQEAYMDTPDVFQDFILRFDNGRYPGLVKRDV